MKLLTRQHIENAFTKGLKENLSSIQDMDENLISALETENKRRIKEAGNNIDLFVDAVNASIQSNECIFLNRDKSREKSNYKGLVNIDATVVFAKNESYVTQDNLKKVKFNQDNFDPDVFAGDLAHSLKIMSAILMESNYSDVFKDYQKEIIKENKLLDFDFETITIDQVKKSYFEALNIKIPDNLKIGRLYRNLRKKIEQNLSKPSSTINIDSGEQLIALKYEDEININTIDNRVYDIINLKDKRDLHRNTPFSLFINSREIFKMARDEFWNNYGKNTEKFDYMILKDQELFEIMVLTKIMDINIFADKIENKESLLKEDDFQNIRSFLLRQTENFSNENIKHLDSKMIMLKNHTGHFVDVLLDGFLKDIKDEILSSLSKNPNFEGSLSSSSNRLVHLVTKVEIDNKLQEIQCDFSTMFNKEEKIYLKISHEKIKYLALKKCENISLNRAMDLLTEVLARVSQNQDVVKINDNDGSNVEVIFSKKDEILEPVIVDLIESALDICISENYEDEYDRSNEILNMFKDNLLKFKMDNSKEKEKIETKNHIKRAKV